MKPATLRTELPPSTRLRKAVFRGSLVLTLSLAFAGCGQKPTPTPAASETAAGNPSPMPSLSAEAKSAAPPGQAKTSPPPLPPAVDFAAADRPVNESGQPLSDLELLNQALEAYRMSATTVADVPKGNFKNQDEEEAARAALQAAAAKKAAPRDLSDLVKAGLIKAVPAAPPGKKYVLDPKAGMVTMVDQK